MNRLVPTLPGTREEAPHVADAWIDAEKKDERDGGVGVVGYEIPVNRHFYQYEIDADLDVLSREIMEMLREVHS